MYGQYSRAVSNQERVIVARVRYLLGWSGIQTLAFLHAQMWARAVVPGAQKAPDYFSSLGKILDEFDRKHAKLVQCWNIVAVPFCVIISQVEFLGVTLRWGDVLISHICQTLVPLKS